MHCIAVLLACLASAGLAEKRRVSDERSLYKQPFNDVFILSSCFKVKKLSWQVSATRVFHPFEALATFLLAINPAVTFNPSISHRCLLASNSYRAILAPGMTMGNDLKGKHVSARLGAESSYLPLEHPPCLLRRAVLGGSVAALLGSLSSAANAAQPAIEIPRGQPPSVALRDGSKMPAIGFGTCCRKSAKGRALIASAKEYLAQGGRLIDTAQLYFNHEELGVAISESGIPREKLWITDKVNTYFGTQIKTREKALASVSTSLRELNVPYIDLMLIHGTWGIGPDEQVEVWRGLIDAKSRGLVRAIGVSNFEQSEIEKLEAATGVRPFVNQLEYHPWVPDDSVKLVRWCQQNGIAVTAYGSLGGSRNQAAVSSGVESIAATYGATSAQVLLRWALAQGIAVIPGATSSEHIRENLYLPSFDLSKKDVAVLQDAEAAATFTRWNNLSEQRS